MIKILQSPWTASRVGVVCYLAMLVFVWRFPPAPAAVAEEESDQKTTGPSWAFRNPEMDVLIAELKSEKDRLAAKEKDLNQLAARLEIERAELGQLTQAVQQVQSEFDQNVTHVREEETVNLKRLAKLYANMSPEGAAAVFGALDDDAIVRITTFMKDSESAPVFELLARRGDAQAKRVAAISERLRLAFTEKAKSAAP